MIISTHSPKFITKYNRNINHLFNRYKIAPESNKNLNEICAKEEINVDLLTDLINCYNDLDFLKKTKFENYRIPVLVDYLEKSHKYYLEKRIPELEQASFSTRQVTNQQCRLRQQRP